VVFIGKLKLQYFQHCHVPVWPYNDKAAVYYTVGAPDLHHFELIGLYVNVISRNFQLNLLDV
jgi:hypothetical protein